MKERNMNRKLPGKEMESEIGTLLYYYSIRFTARTMHIISLFHLDVIVICSLTHTQIKKFTGQR